MPHLHLRPLTQPTRLLSQKSHTFTPRTNLLPLRLVRRSAPRPQRQQQQQRQQPQRRHATTTATAAEGGGGGVAEGQVKAGPQIELQRQAGVHAQPEMVGPADNPFNRERAAVKHHADKTADLWRKLTFYVAIPAIIIGAANAYTIYTEHEEHIKHGPPIEDRVEYSYMNIRTKNFPWGDGDKSLFWNDKYNYHKKD